MYCSKCGSELQHGVSFCASCGAKTELPPQQQLFFPYAYQAPVYQAFEPPPPPLPPPHEAAAAESKAIAALVMGIISIMAVFIAGIILGPLAISNGKKARLVLDNRNPKYHMALAGVITGSIGLAVSIFFTAYMGFFFLMLATLY